MTIYIILLSITCWGTWYCSGNSRKENFMLFVLVVSMTFLCAFRGIECGTDNINYLEIFKTKTNSRDFETLFGWTLDAIPTFRLWMVFYAVSTYILLYICIKSQVRYCTLAILIFLVSPSRFFPETFNIVRQALAASIILLGFIQWQKNRYFLSIWLIILASLFHTSSLIALPFLFLSFITFSKKVVFITLLLTTILGFAGSYNSTIQQFVTTMTILNNTGLDSLDTVVDHYTHYGGKESTINTLGTAIKLVPTCLLCWVCYPDNIKAINKNKFYFNLFFVSTAINNIIIPSMAWGIRFMFSIQLIQILALPIAFEYASKSKKTFIKILMGVLICLFIKYLADLPDVGVRPIVPYEFSIE